MVVFDLESDCTFKNCPGETRFAQMLHMQATLACALVLDATLCLDPDTRKKAIEESVPLHWWRDGPVGDDKNPFAQLLRLFDHASCIVAYNGLDFDFPLLLKHYAPSREGQRRYMSHRLKCLDPLVSLRAVTDLRSGLKLDTLLHANGLAGKTGNGVDAIAMWNDDRRDELLSYCHQDTLQLAKLVLLPSLRVPRIGTLPNHVFGIASALSLYATSMRLAAEADGFCVV